ncbi:MAG: hypothetical protein ACPLZH_03375, partial [Minisyncoccales bacterium]
EEYELTILEDWILLKEGKKFFSFNKEEDNFEKIEEGILDYKVSPDKEKLAIFSNNEIFIFYLKERFAQPMKRKGEKVFITRFSKKIGNLFWLNPDYLIFNVGNKIKVSEIDDRNGMNIYDLAEFREPKISFNNFDKKIYLLSEKNLYILEKLIP